MSDDTKPVPQAVEAGVDLMDVITGIPVPTEVKRSFWKAVGSLITGAAEVPAAWLDARRRMIADEAAARSAVIKALGEAAASDIVQDKQVVERAAKNLAGRLIREQANREAIVIQAAKELEALPAPATEAQPAAEVNAVDEDWLFKFGRQAEQHSAPDIQRYFAKLLAGEIRQPGTYSVATIDVLGRLTTRSADLFARLCDLSSYWSFPGGTKAFVLTEPYGAPGGNSLAPFGLSYENLLHLQEAGLVAHDLNSYKELLAAVSPDVVSCTELQLFQLPGFDHVAKVRASVLLFTNVGQELRLLVDSKPNADYLAKYISWAASALKVDARPKANGG